MARIENSRLTVVGAGSVGVSVAYAALIRGSARTVALYDIDRPKVEAEVLDLAHGTWFTGGTVVGGADPEVVAGSHVVVITAGAKQRPGQTRLDLAGTNVRLLERLLLDAITQDVRDAAYRIIEGKGATNLAIGLACARIVEAILGDQHAVLPVSTEHDGLHRLHGVALSVPSIVGAGGVQYVPDVSTTPDEEDQLQHSAQTLLATQHALGL